MQDIIMFDTDELYFDVLDLITAFSKLSLKDPPIYNVPNDILYILFRLVCAGPPSLETLKQALALTHVCGSWRALAIHIPHLWTYARMFHKTSLGHFDKGPHNRVMVVNSLLKRSARLPFEFHFLRAEFVDICWNAGSDVAPMFEQAFSARSVGCEKLRVAIPSNRHMDMLLDVVKGMKMPVLKRVEWNIVGGERLNVDLEPREEVEDPVYGPDVRMFGWHALKPGYPLPKYHSLLGWLGATYRITTLSIKYLPGVTPATLHPVLLASKDTLVYLALYNHQPVGETESAIQLEPVSLPKLERVDLGYIKPTVLLGFVKLLLLPAVKHLSVRDFGGCPETNGQITPKHYGGIGEEWNTNRSKDAYQLLVGLVDSVIAAQSKDRALVKLDMYGVMCRTTTRLLVLEPLRELVLGLHSLAMVQCDGRFPQLLNIITYGCSPRHLKSLKDLVMTGHPVHTMLLDYLRTRKSVDLPKLKSLGVCTRMAAFTHFFEEFVEAQPQVVVES
ncbi:uncharacterized protein LACBIDRAFT_331487 [Laccaria bicolor S238N-H82]|uniref:Predicted protein n=1 Tax=Laccaria bicolor (strain S238N-H82 / ATCC MYA-4686) TaxID=486041 RepID=B0DPM1_LACBS|nr:uncharacterized protein LACBIDRAFT_331487 [Laccaria bicolor S238N-H82]EDR03399.1 predicted protein [Laccaria bicolor S238N-H82]|eukprot:XP_001885855.1 predicted protein [Laccaria bicolor S238N-H82]